ncbi:glycerol-3-phosphate dehydrogenase/oxidase [Parapedobacter sp. ISTM3]|uniref:glycerol-3-phosphate dehydrogenase/oxidase n=1 Tax=Parapedobacter sp. ISTM3 TaxID=2800130 RepID=UPI0019032BEA|nr:glycerol-3-phosphate dehydrogenase/oxidase [Parapedobacter sp. ISTM3]MBK1441495.1 glycerol-3-phosphate dehydrogenase/oxidase [Parapedobacter sp. ISTM3]
MNSPRLDRNTALQRAAAPSQWDLAIIGGGATGLGIAVDAATRGYSTILLEQHDFAKGTSSRSTKLVHGGVRYLAMGDIKLVYHALYERGLIFKNAPHLAHIQSFIIPCYSFFDKWKYLIGLKVYDWLAGRYRIGISKSVSKRETADQIPGIKTNRLKGGVRYFDGQFDDARLAINLAQTAAQHGGVVLNYCKVTELLKDDRGKVAGVGFTDEETGRRFTLNAKVVVNATGVFVDDILQLDTDEHRSLVRPSQGTHIVVDRAFLGSSEALMIPKTSDGRVLFGIPWHDHLLLGTTDTPIATHSLEPRPLDTEINFILETAATYLANPPQRKDVLSIFAGLRPLAAPTGTNESTKEISRDHKLMVNPSGLITITGGKWTTYRKMAEETVDKAMETGGLTPRACRTKTVKIHGHQTPVQKGHWAYYGSDASGIQALVDSEPALAEKLHAGFDHIAAQAVWAVRHEMARTLEDVLARRLRILFLDAAKSLEMAPKVAGIMAAELGKDTAWIAAQIEQYTMLAANYLPERK